MVTSPGQIRLSQEGQTSAIRVEHRQQSVDPAPTHFKEFLSKRYFRLMGPESWRRDTAGLTNLFSGFVSHLGFFAEGRSFYVLNTETLEMELAWEVRGSFSGFILLSSSVTTGDGTESKPWPTCDRQMGR